MFIKVGIELHFPPLKLNAVISKITGVIQKSLAMGRKTDQVPITLGSGMARSAFVMHKGRTGGVLVSIIVKGEKKKP